MIVKNAIKCKKCNQIIESVSFNDLHFCSCGTCAVDGGLYCLKRIGKSSDYEELSEYSEDKKKEEQ